MRYCEYCDVPHCQYREFGGTCKLPSSLPVSDTNIKVINYMMEGQVTVPSFWAKFRAEAAKDILCAFITCSGEINGSTERKGTQMVDWSVELSDMLIEKLKGETE